jgi:hypothetical protein
MMHGHEKSDSAIVAVKPTNKAERSAAEQSAGLSAILRDFKPQPRGRVVVIALVTAATIFAVPSVPIKHRGPASRDGPRRANRANGDDRSHDGHSIRTIVSLYERGGLRG